MTAVAENGGGHKRAHQLIRAGRRRGYMGVTAFVGLPGSGKTYSLAQVAWEAQRAGYRVYANEGFDPEGAMTYASFEELANVPPGCVILLDEAPLYFNARKWQEFPDGLLYKFTQVRKFGWQFYFSTIDWRMVEVNLRRLTFWVWECDHVLGPWHSRKRFPPEERRHKDERPRERHLYRLNEAVAKSYDTLGTVAVAESVTALGAGASSRWAIPGEAGSAGGATADPVVTVEDRASGLVVPAAGPGVKLTIHRASPTAQ